MVTVIGATGIGFMFAVELIVPVLPGGFVCPSPVRKKTIVLPFGAGLLGPFRLKSPLYPTAPVPDAVCVKIPGAVGTTGRDAKFDVWPRYLTPTAATEKRATS